MKPNPYESTGPGDIATKRIGILRWLALAVSILFCAVPACVAAYAWVTHWHWQRTGEYAQNSFPMNKFASDATLVAIACVVITACCWGVRTIVGRKRNA